MTKAPTTPRQDLARRFVEALGGRDNETAISLMHPNGRLHVQAWQPAVVGTEALLAEFARQQTIFSDFSTEFLGLGESGDSVFTERLDSFKVGGSPVTMHWVGIFDFDEDDLIIEIRDYYDMSELNAQLGG